MGASSLGHGRRGEFPAIFCFRGFRQISTLFSTGEVVFMGELSIFIDESGDFGAAKEWPSFYLVTLVFHEQKHPITEHIKVLEESVKSAGWELDYIHTGPVIRNEEIFRNYSIDERRKLLYKMLNFVNVVPIRQSTVVVDKREASDKLALSGRLAKEMKAVLNRHMEYFLSFDKIIVYYDYGQIELSRILNSVFSTYFNHIEFRKAEPKKYRLLQAADFICSIELLKLKRELHCLSKSEEKFFYKPQELKKTFIKSVVKKQI